MTLLEKISQPGDIWYLGGWVYFLSYGEGVLQTQVQFDRNYQIRNFNLKTT